MIDKFWIIVAVIILPTLGWFANRLFGPSVDALGSGLLNWLSSFLNRKDIARKAYLKLEGLVRGNHVSNGHNRFRDRKTYLHDQQIISFLSSHGSLVRRAIKNVWIEESEIDSYTESDVFFAGMEILINYLSKKDIRKMYDKFRDNDQTPLWPFFEKIEEKKPHLLPSDIVDYLRAKQKEWDTIISKKDNDS